MRELKEKKTAIVWLKVHHTTETWRLTRPRWLWPCQWDIRLPVGMGGTTDSTKIQNLSRGLQPACPNAVRKLCFEEATF